MPVVYFALHVLGVVLLVASLALGWCLTLIGLPGNWLIVVAAVTAALLLPEDSRTDLTWLTVIVLVILATLGEVLEFAAGALGVAKVGGSRRAAGLAIVGSVVGGILGAVVGLPVPVLGSVLAALLGASLGALVGAYIGEDWKRRDFEQSIRVGQAAFWGRLLGTAGKLAMGTAMVVVVLAALVMRTL